MVPVFEVKKEIPVDILRAVLVFRFGAIFALLLNVIALSPAFAQVTAEIPRVGHI